MSVDLEHPYICEALGSLLRQRRFHDVQNLVREIESLSRPGVLQHDFAVALAEYPPRRKGRLMQDWQAAKLKQEAV